TTKLIADGTVQSVNWDSPVAEKMVFGRMVQVLKQQEPNLRKVLVFGLGGGAMQNLISKSFPGVEIISVEIDPVMIDTAKEFFNLDQIPNHRVINDDAFRVVVEPEKFDLTIQSFDAVVIDIYCGSKYPDLGKSGNFFASIKKILHPGGLAVFNRIYLQSHQYDVDLFVKDLSEFFTDVNTTTVAGKTNSDNILIYGRA
ncbi:hypothetical protein A2W32_01060, partial [candidate division WWE3 bacterium RBG_16_37_10]